MLPVSAMQEEVNMEKGGGGWARVVCGEGIEALAVRVSGASRLRLAGWLVLLASVTDNARGSTGPLS